MSENKYNMKNLQLYIYNLSNAEKKHYIALDNINQIIEYCIQKNIKLDKNLIINLLDSNINFYSFVKIICEEKTLDSCLLKTKYKEILNLIIDTYYEKIYSNSETEYEDLDFEKENTEIDSYKLYWISIGKIRVLSELEEKEYIKKIKDGDIKAKNEFIKYNLRLVIYWARRYSGYETYFLDLIQEGNVGLIKAINNFDLKMECKFSTYAVWWIRQSMARYIQNNSRNIRIPVNLHEKFKRYKKVEENLCEKLGRNPSTEELALELGIEIEKALEYFLFKDDCISLNKLIQTEDPDTQLMDLIKDPNEQTETNIEHMEMLNEVRKLIESMNFNYNQKYILTKRFGLDGTEPQTLVEIGKKLNMTRERVRQIESTCLRLLRRKIIKTPLIEYADNSAEIVKFLNGYVPIKEKN